MRYIHLLLRPLRRSRRHLILGYHLETTDKDTAARQQLQQCYRTLRAYVTSASCQVKTNRAAEPDAKLGNMPMDRFLELCTDINEEIVRRQRHEDSSERGSDADSVDAAKAKRGLPSRVASKKTRGEYRKRHDLRSALSVLSEQQLLRMAAGVLCELEKRMPRLAKTENMARRDSTVRGRRESALACSSTEMLFRHKDLQRLVGEGL